MAKFEYKVVASTDADEDDEAMLNELGEQGFELVSVTVTQVAYTEGSEDEDADDEEEYAGEEYVEDVVTYYLKREKQG